MHHGKFRNRDFILHFTVTLGLATLAKIKSQN